MLFMNEMEIDDARERYHRHPVLGPATRFLSDYRHEVNRVSDGWPYWSAPVKAAAKLITLITETRDNQLVVATSRDLDRALRPIKSFYTRRGYAAGMNFPVISPATHRS